MDQLYLWLWGNDILQIATLFVASAFLLLLGRLGANLLTSD